MNKYFLFITYLLLFSAQDARATDPSCPWLASTYFEKSILKEMDPSDIKAIQDLLQGIYENPKKNLSVQDKAWVKDFHLDEAVKAVRASGEMLAKERRQQKIQNGVSVGLGVALGSGALIHYLTNQALEQIDLEGEINAEYGFYLRGSSREDLRFLQALLDCNPDLDRKTNIHEYSKEFTNDVKDIVLILNSMSVRRYENYKDPYYSKLKRLWKETGIVLCTRTGHESQWYWSVDEVNFLSDFFIKNFKTSVIRGLKKFRGMVRVNPGFQPRIVSGVAGLYIPAVKRLEVYSLNDVNATFATDPKSAEVILHELGHAVSDELEIGQFRDWKRINWDFTVGHGWRPKLKNWWPVPSNKAPWDGEPFLLWNKKTGGVYATSSPEENWAEAFACYFIEFCKAQMKQHNRPMYDFVDSKVR